MCVFNILLENLDFRSSKEQEQTAPVDFCILLNTWQMCGPHFRAGLPTAQGPLIAQKGAFQGLAEGLGQAVIIYTELKLHLHNEQEQINIKGKGIKSH